MPRQPGGSLKIELLFAVVAAFQTGATETEKITKAQSLLNRATEVLSRAQTLSAVYSDVTDSNTPYRDLKQTGTVSATKSGQVRVAISRARRVAKSDPWADTGNNTLRVRNLSEQYSVFFHPHSTQVRKSEKLPPAVISEAPIFGGFFGPENGPAATFKRAADAGAITQIQVTGDAIKYSTKEGSTEVVFRPDGLIQKLVEAKTGASETKTYQLESVEIDSKLAEETFAYTPPADALSYERGERLDGLEPGADAPDFTVIDSKGKSVKLSDYRGKVVILKFWATWCWPCNQSLPETEELANKYRSEGVETLAVAIKDSKSGFDAWVKDHPQYAHIRFAFENPNKPDASKAYRVTVTPTVYVIGKDGRIASEFEGFTGPNPKLESALKSALSN